MTKRVGVLGDVFLGFGSSSLRSHSCADAFAVVREDGAQSAEIEKAEREAEEEREKEEYSHMTEKQKTLFNLRLKLVRLLTQQISRFLCVF